MMRCEPLERRRLLAIGLAGLLWPAAVVATEPLPDVTVQEAQESVPAAQTAYYAADCRQQMLLQSVSYSIDGDAENIGQAVLKADLRDARGRWGCPDGVYETVLARDKVFSDGSIDFRLGRYGQVFDGRGLRTQIQLDIADNTVGGDVHLGQPYAKISQGVWWWQRPVRPIYVGCDNPTITVEERATLLVYEAGVPSADTAVENQENLTAVAFVASADGCDQLLTRVVVTSAEGDLRNGQNWTLWADTNGDDQVDTILDDGQTAIGNPTGSQVTFDTIAGGGYVVPEGQSFRFEVRFDAASSFVTDTLRAGLAGLEVERLDDGSPVDWMIAHQPQTLWTFVSQGDLYVAQDFQPVRNRQVLLGELSEPLLILNLRAENEAVDVTYVGIDVEGDSRSIDRLELFVRGEATPFAYATVGGALPGDDFGTRMESQQLVVPEKVIDVLVRARMKRDIQVGVSGDRFSLAVDQVLARGYESSNKLLPNDADGVREGEVFIGTRDPGQTNTPIIGRQNVTVGSKITAITNANPDANGHAVPTGQYSIGQFKFTAAVNLNSANGLNKAVMDGLVFTVISSNVEMDTTAFRLYNKACPTIQTADYTLWRPDGTQIVSGTVTGNFFVKFDNLASATSGVNTRLGSGESQTLVLDASVLNPQVDDPVPSMLQVSLDSFTQFDAVFGLGGSHLSWLDRDAGTDERFDWLDYPLSVVESTIYRS